MPPALDLRATDRDRERNPFQLLAVHLVVNVEAFVLQVGERVGVSFPAAAGLPSRPSARTMREP